MIGIRSIARRAASKVVPLGAFRTSAGVSHHTIPTSSIIPKKPLFSRLFSSSSLRITPEFESNLRCMGIGDELKVDKHEKCIRFAIGEVGDKQQQDLVVKVEGHGEISSVEIQVPDDAEKANLSDGNINFPFVIRARNQEMHCTCYPDTICVDHVIRDEDSVLVPCNQFNMDMPVGVVSKMHLVASGVINPSTIRYLRMLKLELNEFQKCFLVKPEEEFLWSFFSSILDYTARRRFDFKNVCSKKENPSWVEDDSDDNDYYDYDYGCVNDRAFSYDDEDGKPYNPPEFLDRLFHLMTREDEKDEVTIWVQEVIPILADFDEACNQRFIRFLFGLLINGKGTCLQFQCFAYPDGKISIDALEILDDWKYRDCVTAGERIDTTFLDGKSVIHTLDLNLNDDGSPTRTSNQMESIVKLSPYVFL